MSTTKENRVVVNEHIYIALSMADRHCTSVFHIFTDFILITTILIVNIIPVL